MQSLLRAPLAVLAAHLCLASTAGATTLLPTAPPQLAELSDVVVHAKVTAVRSRWASASELVTVAELEVKEAWKGAPPPRLRVVTAGGVLDDLGQEVAGAPRLEPGEEVVLFLYRVGGDVYSVTGMALGKYRVERQDGRPARLIPQPHEDATPAPLPWKALREQLRSAQ